jgi:mannose-6-phosphate isomerase class I
MTSRNIRWDNDEEKGKAKPFLLKPAGKDYLWGGTRLIDEYGKESGLKPLAETWECSTHPDGTSIVASGEWEGSLLSEVLKEHPEYLGRHGMQLNPGLDAEGKRCLGRIGKDGKRKEADAGIQGGLPVLIKFIDARSDLSIQVHPNDQYAGEKENGQLGKTEMWYVLDADKGTQLIYGLYHDVDKETLRRSIQEGTVEKYLQKVKIRKGDVYYIEPGTIHAIGEGALVVEVQESSNLTYRLYDYGRKDKNGKGRELQIGKALEVANLKGSKAPVQPMRVLRYGKGFAKELLCRCKYFEVHRIVMNTECLREMVSYWADGMSFRVLLCVEGCGSLLIEEGEYICFFKGDYIFFPADSVRVRIHGKAEFLEVRG